jgi:hypothetical protein
MECQLDFFVPIDHLVEADSRLDPFVAYRPAKLANGQIWFVPRFTTRTCSAAPDLLRHVADAHRHKLAALTTADPEARSNARFDAVAATLRAGAALVWSQYRVTRTEATALLFANCPDRDLIDAISDAIGASLGPWCKPWLAPNDGCIFTN